MNYCFFLSKLSLKISHNVCTHYYQFSEYFKAVPEVFLFLSFSISYLSSLFLLSFYFFLLYFYALKMTELSTIELVVIVFSLSLIFFSGLCWCFCCGTCGKKQKEERYSYIHSYIKKYIIIYNF